VPLGGKDIADDRHRHPAENPPERPGQHTRRKQHVIAVREAAEKGADEEADKEREKRRFSTEPVDDRRRHQPRHPRRDRVGRDDQTELRRVDLQRPHQLRTERHHKHEINNARELHAPEHDHHPALPAACPGLVRFELHRCLLRGERSRLGWS
jgi:hypothetical protein